jgi:hypothetical protein
VESFKFGYAQRTFYGDPIDKKYPNMTNVANSFIQKDIAQSKWKKIKDVVFIC